jgi:hypothetical protein
MWQAPSGAILLAPVPQFGTRFLFVGLPLVVALLLGALIIAWVKRWQKKPSQLSANEQLTQFRSLYERGEMSAQEFERVRAILVERIRLEETNAGEPPKEPGAIRSGGDAAGDGSGGNGNGAIDPL